MRLMVSGGTAAIRSQLPGAADVLGVLITPLVGNQPLTQAQFGLPMVADNSCFGGLNVSKFVNMLERCSTRGVKLGWVTVPDVVADARATLKLWDRWRRVVEERYGFVPCFVLQDGLEISQLEDVDPPAVFVGGSNEYKLGPEGASAVMWAKSRGKPVHMGRVNTRKRIDYATRLGCDTIDGSGWARWKNRLPQAVTWIRESIEQWRTVSRNSLFDRLGGAPEFSEDRRCKASAES